MNTHSKLEYLRPRTSSSTAVSYTHLDLREQPIEGRFVDHCLEVNSRKALNELFAAFQN